MAERFFKRFEKFSASLDALSEARKRDMTDSFVLSGTSAKFSITFELSWKVMKDILIERYDIRNFVTGSPKETLRQAFKAGLISDEAWLDMLQARNDLSHDYDLSIIKDCCNAILSKYIDLFFDFKEMVNKL